jgi:hypothetical protein
VKKKESSAKDSWASLGLAKSKRSEKGIFMIKSEWVGMGLTQIEIDLEFGKSLEEERV